MVEQQVHFRLMPEAGRGDCEVLSVGHELRDAQSRAWETQKMTVPPLSSPMPTKCTHLKLFLQHRLTALP